jgi:hypothetical protein
VFTKEKLEARILISQKKIGGGDISVHFLRFSQNKNYGSTMCFF